MRLSSLSILIPAYNDASTVGNVIGQSLLVAKKVSSRYEIVIIDDGSADTTFRVISVYAAQNRHVRVVRHPTNKGFGRTIGELYSSAKGAWLFTVPGDGQIDPLEIMKLLPSSQHNDLILGWRAGRNDSSRRVLQSVVYNALLRLLFGLCLHDVNSARLARRSIVSGLTSTSAFIDAEMVIRAVRLGKSVTETPIGHLPRTTGGASGGKISLILPVVIDMIRFKILGYT